MNDKKPLMNDMVVIKKPVSEKQAPIVVRKKIEPKHHEEPAFDFDDQENLIQYQEARPSKNRSGCLLWIIAGICIMVLGIGIGGLFTQARITLTPKTFSGSVDTTVTLSQSHDATSIFFGTATKTFTSEKIVPGTGRVASETKASGMIKFYNTNSIAKTIPAKTEIVSSSGKKYVLVKTVTIPPKNTKNPGQADGEVTAVVAGADGNSGLDDFTFSKPSKTFTGITMHSIGEITGGASGADLTADPLMITTATNELKNEFTHVDTFIARLTQQIPDTMIALPITVPEKPISIILDPKHDDGVHVVASQTITIAVVNKSDIARVIGNGLNVSKDTMLTMNTFDGASVVSNSFVAGQPIPQKIQIRITGTPTIFGSIDTEMLETKILGLSCKETKDLLIKVPELESFKIHMRPFWRRTIPINKGQVIID